MKFWKSWICAGIILSSGSLCANGACADDQTKPGAGNAAAIALAKKSPIVQSAYQFLLSQAQRIEDATLRKETLDALGDTCIRHRAHLTEADKDAIVAALVAEGLVNPADAASIVGGVKAGVFPPVSNDGSACPKFPQAFFSAPGSSSVNSRRFAHRRASHYRPRRSHGARPRSGIRDYAGICALGAHRRQRI